MTESAQPLTTRSSPRMERCQYLKLMREEFQSKVDQFQARTKAKVYGKDKKVVLARCACGNEIRPRISELATHQGNCKSCAGRQKPVNIAHLQKISLIAAQVNRKPQDYTYLRKIGNGAKARCKTHKDYAGKNIKFNFQSPIDFANYVLRVLGPRPSLKHSIDRIDNKGHYEEGNLRWATRTVQNNNKGKYVRWVHGERLERLIQARPDYTYEALRNLIKQGLSDDEIINRRKGSHIRHHQLRP